MSQDSTTLSVSDIARNRPYEVLVDGADVDNHLARVPSLEGHEGDHAQTCNTRDDCGTEDTGGHECCLIAVEVQLHLVHGFTGIGHN